MKPDDEKQAPELPGSTVEDWFEAMEDAQAVARNWVRRRCTANAMHPVPREWGAGRPWYRIYLHFHTFRAVHALSRPEARAWLRRVPPFVLLQMGLVADRYQRAMETRDTSTPSAKDE